MDRLTAVEQSIYAEAELSGLFNFFAMAFYSKGPLQDLFYRLARAEANHAVLLEFEKWRIVREEIDGASITYDDQSLLRHMKKFDNYRASLVTPPEIKHTVELAVKAENAALNFHEDRIFIADFGISDNAVQFLVRSEERHMEILEGLAAAADPDAYIKGLDLAVLDELPLE